MSTFQFIARDTGGRLQRGLQQAESPAAAIGTLRERGWAVIDVRPAVASSLSLDGLWKAVQPAQWLPPRTIDVQLSLAQLAVMLKGGMTLLAALRTTGEQCRRASMRKVWEAVARRIQAGSSFADALARHRCFPPLIVQLARVGEQTGTLEPVLRRGAETLERRRTLLQSLITALTYPLIVLLAAIGVAGFMVVSVIPKLEVFLQGLGRRLPAMTQMLVDVSLYLRRTGPEWAIGLATAAVVLVLLYFWPPSRLVLDRWSLRLPVVGHLFRLSATALMSRGLGMLIRSGVTLLEALRTTEQLHRNRHLRRRLASARDTVLQGGSLAEGLRGEHGYLPMLAAMVTVGEATGTLDDVLDETARFHEEQLALAIRRFSVIIEPVIVVVVGAIVGFVYISFFMALFAAAGPGT